MPFVDGHLGSWRHVHNSPRCPQAVPCWSSWCTSLTHWFPWNWLFGPEFRWLNLAFTCHTPLVGDGLSICFSHLVDPFGWIWDGLLGLPHVNQTIPILRNPFRVLPFGKSLHEDASGYQSWIRTCANVSFFRPAIYSFKSCADAKDDKIL